LPEPAFVSGPFLSATDGKSVLFTGNRQVWAIPFPVPSESVSGVEGFHACPNWASSVAGDTSSGVSAPADDIEAGIAVVSADGYEHAWVCIPMSASAHSPLLVLVVAGQSSPVRHFPWLPTPAQARKRNHPMVQRRSMSTRIVSLRMTGTQALPTLCNLSASPRHVLVARQACHTVCAV